MKRPNLDRLGLALLLLGAPSFVGCGDDDGPAFDGGVAMDSGTDARTNTDAGPSEDAGADDAGPQDAGTDSGPSDTTAPTVTLARRSPAMTPSRLMHLGGTAEDDTAVTSLVLLQGDDSTDITVGDDGSFTTEVMLAPGVNTLTVRAADEAGNEQDAVLEIYFGHRVSVGNSQAAFLREGRLYTWGRNELGQLGNGTLEGSGYGDDPDTSSRPVRYEVDVDGIVSVVTRQTFMLALLDDGSVMTWGSNSDGQLGYAAESDCGSRGTSDCRRTPTRVDGIDNAVAIAAGFNHSLVLLEDGRVMAFGSNDFGQLGLDGDDTVMTPTMVDGLSDIVQLAAGASCTYALTADGTVYAFGENTQGQLGLGSEDRDVHATPMRIDGLADVAVLAASNRSLLALGVNGQIHSLGHNHRGQIGDGTGDNAAAPVLVTHEVDGTAETFSGANLVTGDGFVSGAVHEDGRVFMWGFGFLGQLGQGFLDDGERDLDNRDRASEVPVPDADRETFDIVELEVGAGGPALALTRDGLLFGWGWSFRGSLGLEGAIDAWAYSAPVLVFGTDS